MEVNLNSNKDIVLVVEKKITTNKVTINKMIDFPSQKKVVVHLNEIRVPITLWEGDAYDSIGQWTNTDVENRLKVIYS